MKSPPPPLVVCPDCGHDRSVHNRRYRGGDSRCPGDGWVHCNVEGCDCENFPGSGRWYIEGQEPDGWPWPRDEVYAMAFVGLSVLVFLVCVTAILFSIRPHERPDRIVHGVLYHPDGTSEHPPKADSTIALPGDSRVALPRELPETRALPARKEN